MGLSQEYVPEDSAPTRMGIVDNLKTNKDWTRE